MAIIAMFSVTGLCLTQCSEAPQEGTRPVDNEARTTEMAGGQPSSTDAWIQERETAVTELRDIRQDVEERILDVDNRLKRNDLSAQTRNAIEEERSTLLDLRKRIDRSLEEVEGSDQTTWQSIKEGVNNTTRDVKDWFKRIGEKVDKETKADADDDGH